VTAVVIESWVGLRERADRRPDKGALALLVVPRMEVIGDPHRGHAVIFSEPALPH